MLRIFSFLLFLIIFFAAHSTDSQGNYLSSLSKKLARSLNEDHSDNKRRAEEKKTIGFLDTFAFDPKFVEIEFLDMVIKDEMKLTCFIDGTCSFVQAFSIDDNEPFYPEVETLATPKLPKIWETLSLLNVEVIANSYGFANKMKDATLSLNDLLGKIYIIENDFCLRIGNFSDEITSIIENGMANLKEEILLKLNDTNSDLSLEFQNILAQCFNIIVGLYLQQIARDFQFFDNSMTQVLSAIQNDISINLNALQNYANRSEMLANINNLSQYFFVLSAQFASQFTNYLHVQRDWESIIEGEIKIQIINKFNFPDENLTQAVKNFLLMIIEGRRTLITQSGSLITQQLNQYVSILAQHTTSNLNSLNLTLMQLEDSLNQNQNPQSTDPINSIFDNYDLRTSLFNSKREIDVYGSLSTITTEQFESVLQQFGDLFIKYISNMPEVIANIAESFREQYLQLRADLKFMNDQQSADISGMISNLWENLFQATNFTFKMISDLNNASYQLSDEEVSIYNAYNLFNDSIVPTLITIKRYNQYIYRFEKNITNFPRIHQTNCRLSVNNSGLGEEIQDNITALQNLIRQKLQNDFDNVTSLLLVIENYLGLTTTDNFIDFLIEWNAFMKKGYETAFEIIEAVMSDDFTKIMFLDQSVINSIATNFHGTFFDFKENFSHNALEFEVVNNKVLVDFIGNGMQSRLNTTFHFHHIINGQYGINKSGDFSQFFFEVVPSIFVHVDIINKLQELYLLQQTLTTNIDLVNGKLPISYHFEGDFVEGKKKIVTLINEKIKMDGLNVFISENVNFFLKQNNSNADTILFQQTITIPEDENSQELSISK